VKQRNVSFAALALVLCMESSHAEWVWSAPMNISFSPSGECESIDIDSDGRADLSFHFYYYITMDIPTSAGGGGISISDTHGNYVWSCQGTAQPFRFMGFYPLPDPSEGQWVKGRVGISSYLEHYLDGTWTGWTGLWSNTDLGFIGVLYHDSAQRVHEAWIRLLLPDDRPFPTPIIMDWVYESEPFSEPTASQPVKVVTSNQIEVTYSRLHKGLRYVLEETDDLRTGIWITSKVFNADSETLIETYDGDSRCGFWRLRRGQ